MCSSAALRRLRPAALFSGAADGCCSFGAQPGGHAALLRHEALLLLFATLQTLVSLLLPLPSPPCYSIGGQHVLGKRLTPLPAPREQTSLVTTGAYSLCRHPM